MQALRLQQAQLLQEVEAMQVRTLAQSLHTSLQISACSVVRFGSQYILTSSL